MTDEDVDRWLRLLDHLQAACRLLEEMLRPDEPQRAPEGKPPF